MKQILDSLLDNFLLTINQSDKKANLLTCEDAIRYYILAGGTAKNFRSQIEKTALPIFRLDDSENFVNSCIVNGYISESRMSFQAKSYFITIKGMGYLLALENDSFDLLKVFGYVDDFKLPTEKIKFTKEELLLVLFLLSCNATSSNNKLTVPENLYSLTKTYEKLKEVANSVQEMFPKYLRGQIDFNRGKNTSWTRYITNVDDISKCGLYIKKKNDVYYNLDLQNSKSIQLLQTLCFSHFDTSDKIAFKRYIIETNIKLKVAMPDQLPISTVDLSLLKRLLA